MSNRRSRRHRRPKFPAWAERDRPYDLAWIGENLHVLWPAAQREYQEQGRGALLVDTTSQPVPGAGHPFGYLPQQAVEERGDQDAIRMVREYDPSWEMVVILLKTHRRESIYRVGVPQ